MGELHDLGKLRKRKPLPWPVEFGRVWSTLGLQVRHSDDMPWFKLKRRRQGVEVWLTNGLLSVNLSNVTRVWPSTFKEARRWVAAWLAGYGRTATEATKKPRAKVHIVERRLACAGTCREAWLSSEDPTLFAEAMMRCQHPGAFCASDGFCHYGDCNMEMNSKAPEDETAQDC